MLGGVLNATRGWLPIRQVVGRNIYFFRSKNALVRVLVVWRGKVNANVVRGAQHVRAVAGILALDDEILGFGNGAGAATRNTLQDILEPGLKVSIIDRSGDQVNRCGFDTVYAPTGNQQFHDSLAWHNPQQSHPRR